MHISTRIIAQVKRRRAAIEEALRLMAPSCLSHPRFPMTTLIFHRTGLPNARYHLDPWCKGMERAHPKMKASSWQPWLCGQASGGRNVYSTNRMMMVALLFEGSLFSSLGKMQRNGRVYLSVNIGESRRMVWHSLPNTFLHRGAGTIFCIQARPRRAQRGAVQRNKWVEG